MPIGKSDFSLVADQEWMIELNDTDWGQVTGADRLRNTVAINWRATDALSFEVAYRNQYHFARRGDGPAMDHILMLGTTLNL